MPRQKVWVLGSQCRLSRLVVKPDGSKVPVVELVQRHAYVVRPSLGCPLQESLHDGDAADKAGPVEQGLSVDVARSGGHGVAYW
jgi:hypothetical protein